MGELEETWSFEDALNAHELLDAMAVAEEEERARLEAEQAQANRHRGLPARGR